MTASPNPLPSVVETYHRITSQDAIAIGKRIPSGEIVVPCVAKQNHKHGDARPSLRINLAKDAWRCDPCAALGIEGGRSTHLVVASGIVSTLNDASRWLAPPIPKRASKRGEPAAEYDYCDLKGRILYQVLRFEFEDGGNSGKTFSQRRALADGGWKANLDGVERVPFRLPEMMAAISDGKTIYVVEGEKDVMTLHSVGLVATTNAGGAGWKWTKAFIEFFRSAATVVVIGDNDDVGRRAARSRATALFGVAGRVRLVESMPGTSEKGDVTDWISGRGASAEVFETAIAEVAVDNPFDAPRSASGHVLKFIDWDAVPIESIEWLLKDRLPFSEFTIVEGDGGVGKTTLIIDLISRLSRGSAMPDGTVHGASHCIIIAEEDRRFILKARLLAAGADLANVHLLSGVGGDEHFFVIPEDVHALRSTVTSLGARVVLIDAMFNHFNDGINVNKAQDVRRAIRPLSDAAHETGAAIIGIRHWAKTRGSAAERGLGSVDLRNIARSVITVAPHPSEDESYVAAVSKWNLAPPTQAMTYKLVSATVEGDGDSVDVGRVEWGSDLAVSANELASVTTPSVEEGAQIDVAGEFVVDFLGNGPRPSAEVYAAGKDAGIASSTLLRAAKRRGVQMMRAGFPTRSTWYLLEHDPRRTHTIASLPDSSEASGASELSGVGGEDDPTHSTPANSIHLLHNLDHERDEVSDGVSEPGKVGAGSLTAAPSTGYRPPLGRALVTITEPLDTAPALETSEKSGRSKKSYSSVATQPKLVEDLGRPPSEDL
jgi:hypothetical protein